MTVAELATRGFVGHGENVVLQGLTGTGKIYLARALAKATCARRVRWCHIRQPDLDDLWRGSRERPSGERELVRKYGAFGLLVVDEWPPDKPVAKKHRGQCRHRCPSAITAVLFRDIQQCSSGQILSQRAMAPKYLTG